MATRRTGLMNTKCLSIPVQLCDRVDILLHDRSRGKPQWGGWSQLVSELLKRYADETEMNMARESAHANRLLSQ